VIIDVSVFFIPNRLYCNTFERMTEGAIPGPKLARFSIRISEPRIAYAYYECFLEVRALFVARI